MTLSTQERVRFALSIGMRRCFLGAIPKLQRWNKKLEHVCDPKMQQTPPEVDFGILRISSKRCALMKSMFTVLNSVQQNSIVCNRLIQVTCPSCQYFARSIVPLGDSTCQHVESPSSHKCPNSGQVQTQTVKYALSTIGASSPVRLFKWKLMIIHARRFCWL